MSADPRQLQELISTVQAALAAMSASIAKISSAELRATHTKAAQTVVYAVERWATAHVAEVQAGTRPLEKWLAYGQELIGMIKSFDSGASEYSARFSSLANALGNAAQAVLKQRDDLFKKVEGLVADLKRLGEERKRFEERRALLEKTPSAFSAESRELLTGATASNALKEYERFRTLVNGLSSVVSLVKGGKASLDVVNGDLVAATAQPAAQQTLGAVLAVGGLAGGAALFATCAIAASIATSLWAFFRHLDERLRADIKKAELTGLQDPVARDAIIKAKQIELEADKARAGTGFGDQAGKAVKALVALGVVGGGLYAGSKLLERQDVRKKLRSWGLL